MQQFVAATQKMFKKMPRPQNKSDKRRHDYKYFFYYNFLLFLSLSLSECQKRKRTVLEVADMLLSNFHHHIRRTVGQRGRGRMKA